jgi:hypothetical protein
MNCSWFGLESHCLLLVLVAGWYALLQAGRFIAVRPVWWLTHNWRKGKSVAVNCWAAVVVLLRMTVSNMMLGVTVALSLSWLSWYVSSWSLWC